MKIIFGVILFLATIKSFKAGYIELKENSNWSIMWFVLGIACGIGGIILCVSNK